MSSKNKLPTVAATTSVTARTGEKRTVEEVALVDTRERLRRHRVDVAGRVWVPEIWGQEDFLKDWINCGAFDAALVGSRILTARAALVEEAHQFRRLQDSECNRS